MLAHNHHLTPAQVCTILTTTAHHPQGGTLPPWASGASPPPPSVNSAYQGPALAKAFASHAVRIEVVRRSDGQRGFVVLAGR
jgi:hypothetical protein